MRHGCLTCQLSDVEKKNIFIHVTAAQGHLWAFILFILIISFFCRSVFTSTTKIFCLLQRSSSSEGWLLPSETVVGDTSRYVWRLVGKLLPKWTIIFLWCLTLEDTSGDSRLKCHTPSLVLFTKIISLHVYQRTCWSRMACTETFQYTVKLRTGAVFQQ